MRYCAPTATFDVLQQAQNNLATVVCQRGRTHAKPLLGSLYWLLIRQQVTYKMVSPTITVLSASTSAYLSDLLQTAVSVRPLRLSDVPLPSVPRTQTEFAWQVFSAASSYTRNLLPYDATTTTTTVSRPFVLDYPGEPAPEETFTHSPILIIIQTISFFHLLRSTASYLLNLRAWQSFCTTSFHVLFGLPFGLELYTSYSVYFFTQPVSSFRNTCPYHRSPFCCSIKIISSIPNLCLNSLLGTLSFTLTSHTHLTVFISARWSATSFSFMTGRSRFQTTSHTTAAQPPSPNQWYIPIG